MILMYLFLRSEVDTFAWFRVGIARSKVDIICFNSTRWSLGDSRLPNRIGCVELGARRSLDNHEIAEEIGKSPVFNKNTDWSITYNNVCKYETPISAPYTCTSVQ